VAELIASEFFEQGDIEKRELNIKPLDVMDREKSSELPLMQLGFIDSACMPVYRVILLERVRSSGGFRVLKLGLGVGLGLTILSLPSFPPLPFPLLPSP